MKKFPFLLLDAGPIIKLFSLGLWDNFLEKCDVTVARTVADQALYTEDGTEPIDLAVYEKQGLIKIVELEWSAVKAFHDKFASLYKSEIHPGEKETLAFLCDCSEEWKLCAADQAVFKVLGLLGKGDQGISLEEVLNTIGLSQSLPWQYTKRFREKYTRMGQIDSIQDRGLKKTD